MNVSAKRDGLIQARASTEERQRAEEVMARLRVSSYGQLVRQLIDEKAMQLGVS